MEEILHDIKQGVNVRENLIEIRSRLKEPSERDGLFRLFAGERDLLAALYPMRTRRLAKMRLF